MPRRKDWIRVPSKLIPDHAPPTELAAEVRQALKEEPGRHLNRERPPEETMADKLPEGMSDTASPPEPLKLPEPLQLVKERQPDELVPAFSEMTRVSMADLPRLRWLIERLVVRFPHISRHALVTRLHGYMLDNAYFFQQTQHAVLLATYQRDPFADKPHVWPLFLFETERGPEGGHIAGSQSEKDALQLLRELARWGKHQGCAEIRRLSECCDLPASLITSALKAEKRDELMVRIR